MEKEFDINEITTEVERLNRVLSENKVPHVMAFDKPDNEYCLAAAGNVPSITRLLSAIIEQNAAKSGVPAKDLIEIIKIGLGIKRESNSTKQLVENFKKQAAVLAERNSNENIEPEDFRKNVATQIELSKAIAALTTLPEIENLLPVLAAAAAVLGDDDEDDNDDK